MPTESIEEYGLGWILVWERYQRKDGKPGRWICTGHRSYTQLRTCELCGRFGIPRRVHYRNDCYMVDMHDTWKNGTPLLCARCWNRVRKIVIEFHTIRECRYLVNKITRCALNSGRPALIS